MAALSARHVRVARFPVKNRPVTGTPGRRSFRTAVGWCVSRGAWLRLAKMIVGFVWPKSQLGSFGQNAGDRHWGTRERTWSPFVSRAQRSASRRRVVRCRPGTVPVRGGPGSAMHRFAAARAASHPGHAISCICHSYSCQTAHLVPAARFLRPGFTSLLRSPPSRGGRSAERRSGACEAPVQACHDAARQALARRLASHDAGRSPLGAPPWRFWAPGPRFFSHRTPASAHASASIRIPLSELLAARS